MTLAKWSLYLPVLLGLGLQGCETLEKADQADGLGDFVMILAGKAKPDVAPIEKTSTGGGEVATARAVAAGDHVLVRGSVKKRFGAGWVNAAYAHLDILVLNSMGEVTQYRTTTFSPSNIPATLRGIAGRSYYYASLQQPAAGATIRVRFHNMPRMACQFYQPNPI